jgi:hypothetical protein
VQKNESISRTRYCSCADPCSGPETDFLPITARDDGSRCSVRRARIGKPPGINGSSRRLFVEAQQRHVVGGEGFQQRGATGARLRCWATSVLAITGRRFVKPSGFQRGRFARGGNAVIGQSKKRAFWSPLYLPAKYRYTRMFLSLWYINHSGDGIGNIATPFRFDGRVAIHVQIHTPTAALGKRILDVFSGWPTKWDMASDFQSQPYSNRLAIPDANFHDGPITLQRGRPIEIWHRSPVCGPAPRLRSTICNTSLAPYPISAASWPAWSE